MTSRRWQRESCRLFQVLGANVPVNSASGMIARNLSNELKDLASVAKTEQDVLHMFDWSGDERLGVQIGWYC